MNTTLEAPSASASSTAAQPIPPGMRSVTPHLVCVGAIAAIDFYARAFDAVELMRMAGPDGRLVHACIRIGDSAVMIMDEFPEWGATSPKTLKGSPVTIHLYVENADDFMAKAVEAGATVMMPVQEMFWGDRYGVMEDPFGHRWAVATHVRDVAPEEMQKAALENCGCPDVDKDNC